MIEAWVNKFKITFFAWLFCTIAGSFLISIGWSHTPAVTVTILAFIVAYFYFFLLVDISNARKSDTIVKAPGSTISQLLRMVTHESVYEHRFEPIIADWHAVYIDSLYRNLSLFKILKIHLTFLMALLSSAAHTFYDVLYHPEKIKDITDGESSSKDTDN